MLLLTLLGTCLMKIETLVEIGVEIRDVISSFIKNNEDYGEMLVQRPKDITRKMDMAAENALDTALLTRGLSARIISEELGDRIVGNHPDFMLVVDPIDGSTNATCGIPFFCTSLAYTDKTEIATFDDISMSVICDIQGNTSFVEKGHELFGMSIKGKVLVFPGGKGSTVGSYSIYQLKKNNAAPLAMINIRTEPIVAVGAIISDIPLV